MPAHYVYQVRARTCRCQLWCVFRVEFYDALDKCRWRNKTSEGIIQI